MTLPKLLASLTCLWLACCIAFAVCPQQSQFIVTEAQAAPVKIIDPELAKAMDELQTLKAELRDMQAANAKTIAELKREPLKGVNPEALRQPTQAQSDRVTDLERRVDELEKKCAKCTCGEKSVLKTTATPEGWVCDRVTGTCRRVPVVPATTQAATMPQASGSCEGGSCGSGRRHILPWRR